MQRNVPVTRPRDLQLNNRHSSFIVTPTQLLILNPIFATRQYRRANKRIRLARPSQARRHRIRDINPFQPARSLVRKCAGIDFCREGVGP